VIASQFDAMKHPAPEPAQSVQPQMSTEEQSPPTLGAEQGRKPFTGGELVFFSDRVELSGAVICAGPRSETRRRILDLLRMKKDNGRFASYSGDDLAAGLGGNASPGTVAGAIRDLRDDIMEALRTQAHTMCGRKDVILSSGPGYRFAECITVRDGHPHQTAVIGKIEDEGTVRDVPEDVVLDVRDDAVFDVHNVPDDPASDRRAWILRQLANGVPLKAPQVANHFRCSVKTAQRDLAALKEAGKIEYVGTARTGCYRFRDPHENSR
jgi:hypothetical protein